MTFDVAGPARQRLIKLLEERLAEGADKELVDNRIWELFGETWSVMFTDLVGFSRRVAEFGIIHFLQTIHESHRLFTPCVEDCDGHILKSEGDSLLVLFRSPEKAVACAVAMQRACKAYNVGRAEEEQVLLCLGIGHGRVLKLGDHDVFGAEVNAASKLGEDKAKAGEILVTGSVREQLTKLYRFESLDYAPPGADSAFKLIYTL